MTPARRPASRFGIWFAFAAGVLIVAALAGPSVGMSAICTTCTDTSGGSSGSGTISRTLTVTVNGGGTVSGGTGKTCTAATSPCSFSYSDGVNASISATPSAGQSFTGWSVGAGSCTGMTTPCSITMDASTSITAGFADTTPPSAPAITAPASNTVLKVPGDSTAVTFTNNGDSSTVAYKCGKDSSNFASAVDCNSGWDPGFSTDTHTVYVWARDAASNWSGATSRTFKVVNLPDTSLGGTPAASAIVNTGTTAFSWSSATGTTYLCKLDNVSVGCNSNLNAADGVHTFSVAAGVSPFDSTVYTDPSPATRTWTVDTHAPNTAISTPPAAKSSATTLDVPFTATDPAPGTALHYECKLDTAAFAPCTSPAHLTGLAVQGHTFTVKAIDAAGNEDGTPATASWTTVSDADNDGYDVPQDCNDTNASVHPGAVDIPDDGIDQDCSGADAVNLDRDHDGSNRPADCNDNDPTIHPGAVEVLDDGIDQNCDGDPGVNPDRDGDGVQRPADCNDNNAAIHPGAVDKPENGVDEDCAGGDALWPELASTFSFSWGWIGTSTVLPKISVAGVPSGGKVVITCKGEGCRFKSSKPKLKGGKANLAKLFKKAKLGRKAVVTITYSAPGYASKIITMTMRAPKAPKQVKVCRKPGAKKTYTCRI